MSDGDGEAVEAINSPILFCGYVKENNLDEMYGDVIESICGRIKTICGGIAVTHYSCVDKVIPYSDIYYIETIKQTHMCSIVHKNGTDEIRAEISRLIWELDFRFQIVRSSTIANLSMAVAIENSEIFFPDRNSCLITEKYVSSAIAVMKTAALI